MNLIFSCATSTGVWQDWAFGLMESWFCIWDDLANPKIGLNLIPNPL
ncbi:hypothetical protein [Flavobacterium psychrophilum]|nr:hypothetical protein [Flavobacterium psychrophilum]MCB6088980.1 hypothetical protein [Flavobacterium psychrophilum]MEB3378917.1 hypothetical protein [Flavobacterium psychrophilum]SNA83175.1 hypothetical protein DK095_580040 [Flavobacterium psychrophilum]